MLPLLPIFFQVRSKLAPFKPSFAYRIIKMQVGKVIIGFLILSQIALCALPAYTSPLEKHHNAHLGGKAAGKAKSISGAEGGTDLASLINLAAGAAGGPAGFIASVGSEAASEFVVDHIKGGLGSISGRGPAFKDKARSIIVAVENLTDKTYKLADITFYSGRSFETPTIGSSIGPGEVMVFYFANMDFSWFTGAVGTIRFDNPDNSPAFYVAYSNPYIGTTKGMAYFNSTQDEMYRCLLGITNPGIRLKDLEGIPTITVDVRYIGTQTTKTLCPK